MASSWVRGSSRALYSGHATKSLWALRRPGEARRRSNGWRPALRASMKMGIAPVNWRALDWQIGPIIIFRFTLETVPPEELESVKKFMANFDVTKPIDRRLDPRFVTDYLMQRFSICGTPEECAQRVRELEQDGVQRILLTLPPSVYRDVMKMWAEKVMPRC